MVEASPEMKNYFEMIDKETKKSFKVATDARKKGHDPEDHIEIVLAKNLAERVVGLISVAAPQIIDSGVVNRIMALEKKYSVLDWRVALTIAEEIANEAFCKFKDKREAMEIGIKTGLAYLTLGTVTAPLEGLVELKIKQRLDNQGEYFCLNYSGPIRAAGGTAASVSVIIADYVRKKLGYSVYDPTDDEINRCFTELERYHERVANLQYFPSKEEADFMVKNLPVEISGDPSEDIEVPTYKDLPRVPTNSLRSGFCLVVAEGLTQKAPKLWKQLNVWGKEFDLDHWKFLESFIAIQKSAKALKKVSVAGSKITPDYTYIKDLVAGRPVLGHPLSSGAFRLRYGRSRVNGYSGQSIHPATMHVLNNFIAIATQLKVERPGKATALTTCDQIEGPIVRLKNGSVLKFNTEKIAKQYKNDIGEVLYLGDILINYGDFLDRAHLLAPAGYCEEWWIQELEKATVGMFGSLDLNKLSELTEIPVDNLELLLKNPITTTVSPESAIVLSKKLNIPLHPFYTLHWNTLTQEQLIMLIDCLINMNIQKSEQIERIVLPFDEKTKKAKRCLELIGLPHLLINNEFVVIEKNEAATFLASLGLDEKEINQIKEVVLKNKEKKVLEIINLISSVKIRDKSGTFIGSRMARPEKAKMRKLTGSPQVLFPVGEQGGRLRCFQSALECGNIKSDFPIYKCESCNIETILSVCEKCNKKTKKLFYCRTCGFIETQECKHGKAAHFSKREIDIRHYFNYVLKLLDTRIYPDLIKGVRGTSNKDHVPEHLIKGVLRAKYGLYVNKDGTTRYDCSEVGITHFKPKEVRTSIEKLKELGYVKDIKGMKLESEEQILELKPQDIILPCCPDSPEEQCDEILFRTTMFLDELLVKLYDLDPFYKLKSKDDLVGHLIVGLAPHTSNGTIGRIVGFSKTQGFFAHPLFHAAMRRDVDGDESCIFLLMDAFLNFSRRYIPVHRGSTMDAPLVLTSMLNPTEVDDMAFNIDIVWKYPLELYEAALEYKMPWEIKIKTIKDVLNTPQQYEGIGFTHDTSNINSGVTCSAYKTLPSMEEKLKGQMEIAEKLRSVDTADVARLVIEKHFIRDIKGNLRKFSQQVFRCVKCNEKFRRPPLIGRCSRCGGKIIFTISEGGIVKYLGPSISLAEKYNVSSYLKQSLELAKRGVEGMFGREKETQEGLGRWFG